MDIRITGAKEWNWYKGLVGEVVTIKDQDKYGDIGVQVFRSDGEINLPDVIEHQHYEFV